MADEPIQPQEQQQTPSQAQASVQAGTASLPQATAKKSTSGLAVAGLVLGLIALLSCWIPFFNVVTTSLAILGLVFAIIGIVATAPAKPKGGRGIAIAGTVLCAISLVVFMAMYGGAAASVGAASSDASSNAAVSASDDSDSADSADEDTDADADADSDSAAGSDSDAQDSGIVIKSCKASEDYSGNKTAVITLEWTNNEDKTAAFYTMYTYDAYVDGEEVDRAFASGDGWYEDQTKIKAGKTKTIKLMYDWDGKSDIDFEVSAWFSSDPVLSETLKVK